LLVFLHYITYAYASRGNIFPTSLPTYLLTYLLAALKMMAYMCIYWISCSCHSISEEQIHSYARIRSPVNSFAKISLPLFYDEAQQQLGPRTPSVVYGPNSVRDADWSFGSIRRIDANAIGQRRRDLIIIDCLHWDWRCSDLEHSDLLQWDFTGRLIEL